MAFLFSLPEESTLKEQKLLHKEYAYSHRLVLLLCLATNSNRAVSNLSEVQKEVS